jgi:hemolysin III
VGAARDAAGERLEAASEQLAQARDAAAGRLASAAEMAAVTLRHKPRLRGVSHQWAFFVSLFAGAVLLQVADPGEPRLAAGIYAASLSGLFGVSALYHRVDWQPVTRRWMRRLDHTMIFLLIAGTYTPFALLVLEGDLARLILIAVWACAAAGIVLNLIWWNAPKPVTAAVYLATGWVAIVAMPELVDRIGWLGVGLIALGGALYTAGAVIYARRRPDPHPAVFGYHEIFHLLVIAAAATHYAAVAIYALPAAS